MPVVLDQETLAAGQAAKETESEKYDTQIVNDFFAELQKVENNNVKELINYYTALVYKRYENKFTLLHLAAEIGNEVVVIELLKAGANIEAKDQREYTPLHWSIYFGHIEVVKFLIEKGAIKEAKGQDGITPLHLAAEIGNEVLVLELLKAGANIEAKDQDGQTPLHN